MTPYPLPRCQVCGKREPPCRHGRYCWPCQHAIWRIRADPDPDKPQEAINRAIARMRRCSIAIHGDDYLDRLGPPPKRFRICNSG